MQVEVTVTIGDKQLRVVEDVSSQAQMFDRLEFWDSIPRIGPNGETDLKFVHRTPKGFDYYEIVCESAKMRFQFGQLKDDKGSLFPKGWVPLHQDEDEHQESDVPEPLRVLASTGQVGAITALIEDIKRQGVRHQQIANRLAEVIGRNCGISEIMSDEAPKVITLLRNKLAEVKTAKKQQKAEV